MQDEKQYSKGEIVKHGTQKTESHHKLAYERVELFAVAEEVRQRECSNQFSICLL